jgi:hypothetical protein
MDDIVKLIITGLLSAMASSGFWIFLQKRMQNKDAKTLMLIGLGHDRIIRLGLKFIEKGWVTEDEYENLNHYLFKPYKQMGGNGSADRIMREVNKLPIRGSHDDI